MAEETRIAVLLGVAAAVLLVLAWMVGVLGMVRLINNYRAHPERYPDAQGLARWMGLTLAAGGLSLGLCAIATGTGAIDRGLTGAWAGVTGALVAMLALASLARHRVMPGKHPRETKER